MRQPVSALVRIARAAALAPAMLAAAALFGLMLMTFADVVLRSALDAPIEVATELTRIAMAVIVFSVLPVVSARGDHITVDLLDPFFGPAASRWRDAAVSLGCGVALWWPAGACVLLAERARDYGDVTEHLGIPEFYVGWFIALCVYATAALLVLRGVLMALAPAALSAAQPATRPDDA